jgi:hypothetical protein
MIDKNGTWRAIALSALALLQALSVVVLSQIYLSLETLRKEQKDQARVIAGVSEEVAIIKARHIQEDRIYPNLLKKP